MIEWIPLKRGKTGRSSDMTFVTRDLSIGDIKRLWAKYTGVNQFMLEVYTTNGRMPDHSTSYMAALNKLPRGAEMIFRVPEERRFRREYRTEESGDEEDEGIVIPK